MREKSKTFDLLRQEFCGKDYGKLADQAGALWDADSGVLTISYLTHGCKITLPDLIFRDDQWLTEKEKVLICHYLLDSRGLPSTSLVSFKEMEAGNFYFPSFQNRVINPLLEWFGGKPEMFLPATEKIGGKRFEDAPLGVVIPAFPKVSVYFLLYPADEEFPPELKVLFSGSIKKYLDTEDAVVLCEEIVARLMGEK